MEKCRCPTLIAKIIESACSVMVGYFFVLENYSVTILLHIFKIPLLFKNIFVPLNATLLYLTQLEEVILHWNLLSELIIQIK